MPKFTVKAGAQPGAEIPMEKNRLVFGRGEDCDVVIADENVSRRHAQAVVLNELVTVMDLNSSNGTFVNGLPVSRIFLMDGDEVRLGETVLVFSEDEGVRVPGDFGAESDLRAPKGEAVSKTPEKGQHALEQIDQTLLFKTVPDDEHSEALKEVYLKLKALYRVFHQVAEAKSLKDMFEIVGRALTVTVAAERVTFLLNAERTGANWQNYYTHTSARLDSRAAAREVSEDVLNRVREDRRLIQASVGESGKAQFGDKDPDTVALPLMRGGTLTAAIYVDNPESHKMFSKNDVDFIATLGLQVSVRLNQFEQVQQLKQENVTLRRKVEEEHAFVVHNEKMKQIMSVTARVAESDSCVLVTGESGTGKELIANAIHNFSRRSKKPLVAVNCAAMAETLLESELFGHEKGAFTGAVERRIGKFELADGGTLFLDEIGDISAAAQAKLLRALQEGEIQRVGGTKTIKVDVRLIAATNKDLSEEVRNGNFRQDLFFRVKVIEMKLPALRERRDEIPVLADHFLKQLRSKFPTPVTAISPEAVEVLAKYSFPGNIRELRNIIERGMVFATGEFLLPEHLPMEVFQEMEVNDRGEPQPRMTGEDGEPLSLAEVEKNHIQNVLRYVKGNKLRAAGLLGISRTTLYEKLRTYGLGVEEKVV